MAGGPRGGTTRPAARRLRLAALGLLAATGAAIAADPCRGISPVDSEELRAITAVSGLSGQPLLALAPSGDFERLFVVEQAGLVRFHRRGSPPHEHEIFLDLRDRTAASGERGLLGLAFDPEFTQNGWFYVDYTRAGTGETVVSRFSLDAANPDRADPASEIVLLTIAQPRANHNGGHLEFGPDGMLYVAVGDGGGANDDQNLPCGNGQDRTVLLGKLLRIDPRAASGLPPDCGSGPYTIPADNPLADGSGGNCDEIWAWGLRNPWRFGFDPPTGDLYVGDVGQGCWEEVNYADGGGAGGKNYGWRQMEGRHCFASGQGCDPPGVECGSSPSCGDPALTLPLLEYPHTEGCSVTGGRVYRGCRLPLLAGSYFYGDFCGGWVRSFRVLDGKAIDPRDWTVRLGAVPGLASFGRDARGELYLVSRTAGTVQKLVPRFADLEVSGPGADPALQLGRAGGWSWEDLGLSTLYAVQEYRVYRGVPGGLFLCIHATAQPGWPEGDSAIPGANELLAYLVTAVSGGEETRGGGPPRQLVGPCPPPGG